MNRRFLIIALSVALALVLGAGTARAQSSGDKVYTLDRLDVDLNVLRSGDFEVVETQTYTYVKGQFKGYGFRDIPLNKLAAVACFSPFHFHRLFSAFVGEPPAEYVRRLRLENLPWTAGVIGGPWVSGSQASDSPGFVAISAYIGVLRSNSPGKSVGWASPPTSSRSCQPYER